MSEFSQSLYVSEIADFLRLKESTNCQQLINRNLALQEAA